MPQAVKDKYLGDGVYASWDGRHVFLDLRAQPLGVSGKSDHVCKIALEPEVLFALDAYRRVIRKVTEGGD